MPVTYTVSDDGKFVHAKATGVLLLQEIFDYIRDEAEDSRIKPGYCVLFDSKTKLCKVYENRPQGCRFYPLTFNLDTKLCVLDEDCPRPELFYPSSKSRINTCKKISDKTQKFAGFNSYLYMCLGGLSPFPSVL